jgi:hypothetical protein
MIESPVQLGVQLVEYLLGEPIYENDRDSWRPNPKDYPL